MADIRKSKKVQQLSIELRESCARRGVHLLAGDADQIVAERIAAMAQTLGVTTRTVLDRYVLEDFVSMLASALAEASAAQKGAVESADSVTIEVAEAGRVLAALGMHPFPVQSIMPAHQAIVGLTRRNCRRHTPEMRAGPGAASPRFPMAGLCLSPS